MPTEPLPFIRAALARQPDGDGLRQVVADATGGALLAFDKAIAHRADPARYPLSAEPGSLEQRLAARLDALPKDARDALTRAALQRIGAPAAARRTTYGPLGAVDPGRPEPVRRQARSVPLPPDLGAAASVARARLEAPARAAPAAARQAALDPRLVQTDGALQLWLTEICCAQKTGDGGLDEIAVGAVATDFLNKSEATAGPIAVGRFKTGDRIAGETAGANLPRLLHAFPITDAGLFSPACCSVALMLAETDPLGGFKQFIERHGALSDHQFNEIVAIEIAMLAGGVMGLDVVIGACASIAEATGVSFLSLLGIAGGTHLAELVAMVIMGASALLTVAVANWLQKTLGDDIFPPVLLPVQLGAGGEGAGDATFTLDRASYTVSYRWKLVQPASGVPARLEPLGTVTADAGQARANLQKIDHVVVLMLENRSFDHMLGYLTIDAGRADVDGLTAECSNTFRFAPDQEPRRFFVQPAPGTALLGDPSHDAFNVTEQLAGGMGGFVEAWAKRLEIEMELGRRHADPGLEALQAIMNYHPAAHVPVFDFIAQEFGICDRWFSSFPGNTWVNRTFAFAGQPVPAEPKVKDGQTFNAAGLRTDNGFPLQARSFFRQLSEQGVSWRFYSQDLPSLPIVDLDHAANPVTRLSNPFRSLQQLLDDLARGELPQVAWLDPNFRDLQEKAGDLLMPLEPNDDHPPSDISQGQVLVGTVVSAVMRSPAWAKTMLVILYDEHGGFYDHVTPETVPDEAFETPQEARDFRSLGVRVPALVVSPWVGRRVVLKRTLDHTSLIKTILLRFCAGLDGSIPHVSNRVDRADHLGYILNADQPRFVESRALPGLPHLLSAVGQRLNGILARGRAAFPENDLQKQLRENEPLLHPWRVGR